MDEKIRVFLAYPSEPAWLQGPMSELAKDLGGRWETMDWEEPLKPGLVWDAIQPRIDSADLLLAQITRPNGNVYFELGYMIGRDRAVFGLIDKNYRLDGGVPALDTVAHIEYERRVEIIEYLERVSLGRPTLFEQLRLPSVTSTPGRIFFLPARGAGDFNDAVLQVCRESDVFNVGTTDHTDPVYDSLPTQAQSIAECDIFVTVLVNDEVKHAAERNAQVMLYAGLACGLGREVIVCAQEPQRRLLDLGDALLSFQKEPELRVALKRRLSQAARIRITAPVAPQPRSIVIEQGALAELFLGNLDARADAHLIDYFVRIPEFLQIRRGERHLVVGSKGSGKTALYEMLRREFDGQRKILVEIAPSNFEFPRLAGILQDVSEAHWEFVFGSFWRFILITEVLREIRANFVDFLLTEGSSSSDGRSTPEWPQTLLRWIDENSELLELDFVSRVTAVLAELEQSSGGSEQQRRSACEALLQVARMYDVERALFDFSQHYEIHMLVDDLDRNWLPSSEASNRMLVSLLTAIHDLMDRFVRADGQFLPGIFVRADVYDWLRTNDAEITRRDPARLRWTSESLERMIAARIATRTRNTETDPATLWDSVFPTYLGEERASQFVISRTHKRPRDVLRFCQVAVDRALHAGRARVSEVDLRAAWEESGQLALAQAEKEYETRYPRLGAVALFFFDKPIVHRWSAISQELALFAADQGDSQWLQAGLDDPETILEALYVAGIVGLESHGGTTIYADERPYPEIRPALETDFQVHVHPAFRQYLRTLGNWDARPAG